MAHHDDGVVQAGRFLVGGLKRRQARAAGGAGEQNDERGGPEGGGALLHDQNGSGRALSLNGKARVGVTTAWDANAI